jgi:hypothetical protein
MVALAEDPTRAKQAEHLALAQGQRELADGGRAAIAPGQAARFNQDFAVHGVTFVIDLGWTKGIEETGHAGRKFRDSCHGWG